MNAVHLLLLRFMGLDQTLGPIHIFAAFLLLGVIDNQFDYLTFARVKVSEQFAGLHLQNNLAVPSAEIEKVVEAAAVRLILVIEMPVERANVASSPKERYKQDRRLEVLEVIEVEMIL